VGVDRRSPDRVLLDVELADRAQQLARGGHDLGADAVAGEGGYAGRAHGGQAIRAAGAG
jgi:hypothetical protein